MSVDKSLKLQHSLQRPRSVLSRAERLAELRGAGKWQEGQSVFNLPKVRVRRVKRKKAAKAEVAEAAAPVAGVTPGAPGASAPAGVAAARPGAAAARPGAAPAKPGPAAGKSAAKPEAGKGGPRK